MASAAGRHTQPITLAKPTVQSIQVQHGLRSVTLYYEIQHGRDVFWTTSVLLAPNRSCQLSGALFEKRMSPDCLLESLVASVRRSIDWLEVRPAIVALG